jgi:hypothetical protein
MDRARQTEQKMMNVKNSVSITSVKADGCHKIYVLVPLMLAVIGIEAIIPSLINSTVNLNTK